MKQEKHIKQLVYSVGILFCIMMLTYLGWRGYRYYLYYQLRQAPQVELNSRFLGNGRINSQTISSLNRNRRKAQDKGYNRYASGILKIPSIKVDLPIFFQGSIVIHCPWELLKIITMTHKWEKAIMSLLVIICVCRVCY